VSVEAPRWAFPIDAEDVAIADPTYSTEHHNVHYLVMKPHLLRVRFSESSNGEPKDIPDLMGQIRDVANKEMPYAYRLDTNDKDYVFVPTRTLNSSGQIEELQPLLDHHVSIPSGTRSIAEHAGIMARRLSQQTGFHVSCCQAVVAGVPWGMARVTFEAHDSSARDVLRALIHLEENANSTSPARHPRIDRWTVGCDGTGAPWCFIEVESRFNHRCSGTLP
jgi:hypothetical protein